MSRNGTASTSYYEDDGATKDYQEGEYNQTRFELQRSGDVFAFTAQPRLPAWGTLGASSTPAPDG